MLEIFKIIKIFFFYFQWKKSTSVLLNYTSNVTVFALISTFMKKKENIK